jgi:hypothetical protein
MFNLLQKPILIKHSVGGWYSLFFSFFRPQKSISCLKMEVSLVRKKLLKIPLNNPLHSELRKELQQKQKKLRDTILKSISV